jgi:type IV pilus assembly protein PilW
MTALALKPVPPHRRVKQSGVSLIEVMVSLVIGLFVIGAVLMNYLGSGTTGRQQSYVSQMSEDAQIGFSILNRDLQMAGYSNTNAMVLVGGTATFARPAFRPIFGCDAPFLDAAAAFNAATCGTATGTSTHAIEVNYQATTATVVLSSAGVPTDCIGNTVAGTDVYQAVTGPGAFMTSNRYYVADVGGRPELHCASQAATTSGGQPLVENVQAMRVRYGVATAWSAAALDSRRAVRYVEASNVTDWNNVVSVRTCLLMRSSEAILTSEDVRTYTDCDGVAQTSADNRLYRAFFSTTAIRNRVAF